MIDSVGVVNGLERYDGNTIPHAHIVCESCGAVLDAETIELPDELLAHVQQDTGCAIRRYQIQLHRRLPQLFTKALTIKNTREKNQKLRRKLS